MAGMTFEYKLLSPDQQRAQYDSKLMQLEAEHLAKVVELESRDNPDDRAAISDAIAVCETQITTLRDLKAAVLDA